MKIRTLSVVFGLAGLLGLKVAAQQPQGIQGVAWLQGCWELSTLDRMVGSQNGQTRRVEFPYKRVPCLAVSR